MDVPMADNPDIVSITDQINAAGEAAKAKDHRRAASLFFGVSTLCGKLWQQPDPPLSKPFLEMGVHYFQAAAHRSLYLAATAEDESRTTREDYADALIRSAREAIAVLARTNDNTGMRDEAYGMLMDGFDGLMASRGDLHGMADAGRRMEAAIDEYRKIVSPAEFQRVFKRLLYVRAQTNMTEAIEFLFHDRNFQASQQSFKRAREFTGQAIKATDDATEREQLEGFLALLLSMSNLGEALTLQERGGYLAAAAKMKEAEYGFEITREPAGVGLSLWAKAAQPYYRAMNDEVEGADDAAVKGYEQASKAFSAAADAFPASSPDFASMGSWIRFSGESAAERAKSVLTRKGWRQRQQEKAKLQAGLIFFGLWLIAIGASVAAARVMALNVNAYTFLTLIVVCFLIAGVAAALIKADVAVHLLSPLLGHAKGNVSNDSNA
jgi:hypothetical protein